VGLLVLAGCSSEAPETGTEPSGASTPVARGSSAGEQESSATSKLKELYESATSGSEDSGPRAPDESIVRCRLSSGTQYLRRYDCDLRGGTVAG
jgi:hypothetical protein